MQPISFQVIPSKLLKFRFDDALAIKDLKHMQLSSIGFWGDRKQLITPSGSHVTAILS